MPLECMNSRRLGLEQSEKIATDEIRAQLVQLPGESKPDCLLSA
jgi:hypothetical protein